MERLLVKLLGVIIEPSSISAIALLLVIFWMFRFIGKLLEADKAKTATLTELTVLLRLLLNKGGV